MLGISELDTVQFTVPRKEYIWLLLLQETRTVTE